MAVHWLSHPLHAQLTEDQHSAHAAHLHRTLLLHDLCLHEDSSPVPAPVCTTAPCLAMVGLHPGSLPYCTPYEVAKHSSPQDCWVSVYGKVLDVTSLVKVCNRSLRLTQRFVFRAS